MNRKQQGFTLIELMIVVAIIGILAAVALPSYQDYTKKARMSEVVLAASSCRTTVTEVYQSATAGPGAGKWGCESNTSTSKYVQKIGTDVNGVIAVQIAAGIDSGLDNQYVYLVPYHNDTTPKAVETPGHMGAPVFKWVCGSDNATVRKYLPGSCSATTTAYSALFS